jgi:hypothetical protein
MMARGNSNTPAPGFDAALKAITDGVQRRDTATPSFLGVYID